MPFSQLWSARGVKPPIGRLTIWTPRPVRETAVSLD